MDGFSSGRLLGEDLSPFDLLRRMRQRWRFLGIAALAGLLAMLLAVRMTTPHYTAEIVVGPVARSGAAAMGPQMPVSGGSGGRAMVEPGLGDELLSDYTRYLRLLGSVPVAERLAADPSIMPGIFHRAWDREGERWHPPDGLGAMARRALLWLVGRPTWTPPDARALADHLRTTLIVEPLGQGPMQRIAYRHHDRAVALAVIAGVTRAADDAIRAEARRRVRAEIEYIRARLEEVSQAEHRKALTGLLAEQERMRMMIDVDLPFAADAVEAAGAPVVPDWPDPMVLVPLGGLVGFIGGLFLVYAQAAWDQRRRGAC
ncbi:MAG: hypothetical protein RLY86_2487 [Pseudomonadota bacterium]|jgi:uncharacterized protein involved in exopolysaccharide biosynthesis